MKNLLLFCLVLMNAACFTTRKAAGDTATLNIAFGSCNDVKNPNLLWDDIIANRPVQWIWLGDNIYGNEKDLTIFQTNYAKLLADTGYRRLRQTMAVDGIWDDGDYGPNNGGADYIYKDSTKKMLLDFLQVPAKDPRRTRGGVYYSKTLQEKGLQVKLIFLDTRYFRGPLVYQQDSIVPNPNGDMLGADQWNWLEQELKSNTADVTVVASGIQVLATGHRFEKWSNFPASKERLFRLLKQYPAQKMCFISGDRHIGEIAETTIEGIAHPVIDITSSSLTNPWSKPRPETNVLRKGTLVYPVNFGLIQISKTNNNTSVALSLRGNGNNIFESVEF